MTADEKIDEILETLKYLKAEFTLCAAGYQHVMKTGKDLEKAIRILENLLSKNREKWGNGFAYWTDLDKMILNEKEGG